MQRAEQWSARYGGQGNSEDYATDIAVDHSGNVYVTGVSDLSGTATDCITIKYNAVGIQQWVARSDGPVNNEDDAMAIAVDISGNVLITGSSWSCSANDHATITYNPGGTSHGGRGVRGSEHLKPQRTTRHLK